MNDQTQQLEAITQKEYKAGFYTDIESDSLPPGLNEDVVRQISMIKGEPEFMLEWRLKAYRHWLIMNSFRNRHKQDALLGQFIFEGI